MAYIRKVGAKWRAEVERHGNRDSKLCDTKADAQAWAIRKEVELDALKSSKGKTFGAATAYYLKTVSPSKVDAVEWETRRFAAMEAHFGVKTPLSKIDSAAIGKWRDKRLETVLSSTVLREINLLRNLFKLARNEWKWISHDPFQGVRMPEDSPERETVWNWRQIRRVLRYCQQGGPKQQEVGRAFHIALRTAMRLREVLSAKLSGGIALIPRDKNSGKVVSAPVKVPLTSQGVRVMRRYPPFVHLNGPDGPLANEASTLFSQVCQDCGVRKKGEDGVTFHDSRATALTLLARKVDVLTLSRISRHRDINILQRRYYRETAEQIAARLNKPRRKLDDH